MSFEEEWQNTRGPCVLLESTSSRGPRARLSLLARRPRAILIADRTGARVATASGVFGTGNDPLAALRGLLDTVRPGRWPEEGGVAGALAYDFARPARPPAPRRSSLRWRWTASS